MKLLADITLFEVLRDWGLHEGTGRLPAMGWLEPALVNALRRGGTDADVTAVQICLQVRAPVIARVLAATPTRYVRVEVTAQDIEKLFVMSAEGEPRRSLRPDAEKRASGSDDDNEWTRDRIAKREPVSASLFAVARAVPGELTILDGVHRAAAWVKHADTDLRYPIVVNVAITLHRVWHEGS